MKRFLLPLTLITSLYAVPPCELPEQTVCAYLYKGAMSSEIIITNLSTDTILIKNIYAYLDGNSKSISDLKLAPGQNYTMLKSRYDDHLKKPSYNIGSMQYKIIK